MSRKFVSRVSAGVLALSSSAAWSDGHVSDLEARVAALEESSLSFGGGGNLEVYGYVKGDLIFDLDADLGTTSFGIANLIPGAASDENFRAQAIQSRLGVRYTDDTSAGDLLINLEGDFFGNGGGGFRLRQAYGRLGSVLAGQTWTNFMPIESYPGTLDFQGPAGIPFARVMQLRYTADLGTGLNASFSAERAAGNSSDPALTAAVTYGGEGYFLKASVVSTQIEFGGDTYDGMGFNLSGNASLWEGGSLQASYTMGEGINSYMVFGGDDVATIGGVDTVVESSGLTLGLSQALGGNFTGGLVYGYRENEQGNVGTTESIETMHATLTYRPVDNVSYGIEYITGERSLFGGDSASADRIQASFQYNF